MKFEPIDYGMIVALNIKRVFVIIEDDEEGIAFEQLKKNEDSENNEYYYWQSATDEWSDMFYKIEPDKKYYILTRD